MTRAHGASVVLVLQLAGVAYAQEAIVFRGAMIIDGTGASPVPNAVVVVRGDRIEAIGPGIAAPAGARVIDVVGKFILPGLWDKHLHCKDWFPELLITNGVTSAWARRGAPGSTPRKRGSPRAGPRDPACSCARAR